MSKLIYIASPYAGDIETNVSRAQRYCRFVINRGCVPFAPHLLYPQILCDDDKDERALALSFALVMLMRCDALWVFGERITLGMATEIAKAKELEMPIKYLDGFFFIERNESE